MNLENYVSTLEQSKKLDALLGRRWGIFYYGESEDGSPRVYIYGDLAPGRFISYAYTSQELGEIISETLREDWGQINSHEKRNHEAQARAEFLIYLLEK